MGNSSVRNEVAAGLFWTYAERITAQAVSFIVSIILARLIMPEHYGVVTLVNIFINIANVFVSDSFGNVLIQKKTVGEEDFSTVFFMNFFVATGVCFIFFFLAPCIASFYKEPQITLVLRVLSFKLILASLNSVQNAYVSRNMKFKNFFCATLIGTIISAIVGIYMAYSGFGVWALVAQYLTNSTIDTAVLHFTCGWKPQFIFRWNNARKMISFGGALLVSALIQKLYDNMRSLLIGAVFTTTDLSYYDRGKRFPALLVDNINTSISKTLFPVLSKEQDNKARVLQMTRRTLQVSAFLLSPLLVGMIVCGKSIITLLLTDKWLPCVPYMQIVSLAYLFMPLHKANLQAIKALGRGDIILKMEVIKKIFGILVVLVAAFIMRSTIAIAWTFVISTLFNAVVNAVPNIKLLNYKVSMQLEDLFPAFGCAGIMGVSVYLIQIFNWTPQITLLVQIAAGAMIYLIVVKIFKLDSLDYCVAYIAELRNKQKG